METILSCPFCNSTNIGAVDVEGTVFRVTCFDCDSFGPPCPNEETAFRAWNNRVPDVERRCRIKTGNIDFPYQFSFSHRGETFIGIANRASQGLASTIEITVKNPVTDKELTRFNLAETSPRNATPLQFAAGTQFLNDSREVGLH
jgi:hypothetical protein